MPIFKKHAAILGAAIAAPALMIAGSLSAQPTEPQRTNSFSGTLTPLSGSGVSGTFTIEQKGQGQIRVNIQATGLEVTDQPHVGHIHGLENKQDSVCPTMAQDVDSDGFIELAEGLQTYGPIIVPLGDVDPDNDGVVNYSMTFNINKSSTFQGDMNKEDLLPLETRHIVLHGRTLQEGQGATNANSLPPNEADGTAGYKTVLPVACGEIERDPRNNGMEFRTP